MAVRPVLARSPWFALAIALAPATGAFGATVTGRIMVDMGLTDSRPAPFVAVTLASQTAPTAGPVQTGRWGNYYFHDVAPGVYTLEIWTTGYRRGVPATRSVTIADQPAVELEEVVVSGIR